MHRLLSLARAVTCLTLAITAVGRPAFDTTENDLIKRLIERDAQNLGSTCDLPQGDANSQWAATKVPQFLDSLLERRGSGKMGSIEALDKVVDMMATGQTTSEMDCTDFNNQACPLPSSSDCADTKKYSTPVWYWMQVAFSNFNAYNSQLYNTIAFAAISEGLNIQEIANDVNQGWDTDPVTTSTLYNHVGAGLAIGGSIVGNIPEIGPLLSLAAGAVGAFISERDKQASIDLANAQANAKSLQSNAVTEMSNKVTSAMNAAQSSLVGMSDWMFKTGSDWPNQTPPSPAYDDDEMYLPTQIYGEGAYLYPVSNDAIQAIQGQMVHNMRQSLFGLALKANEIWATWINKNDMDQNCDEASADASENCKCINGWVDTANNCWSVTAYPPGGAKPAPFTTMMIIHNQGGPSQPGMFGKYDIDPWAFYANILDCAVNPTPDGEVDMSQTKGPWPDSMGGLPKCFFSVGVTKAGNTSPGLDLPPDGSAQNPNPGVPLNQIIMTEPGS